MKIGKVIFILVALSVLTSTNNANDESPRMKNNCRVVKQNEEKNSEESVILNNKVHLQKDKIDKFDDYYDEERHSGPKINFEKYFLLQFHSVEMWNMYKKKYKLEFTLEEEEQKYKAIYNQNLALLTNQPFKKNNTFELGENEFFHLNFDEFEMEKCGTKVPDGMVRRKKKIARFFSTTIPNSLSYTHLMPPIQNQGSCGCCWSFATISLIEAAMKKKNSSFRSVLSPSYLVDCDTFNNGCRGGWPAIAIDWLIDSGGNRVISNLLYPYRARKQTCINFPIFNYIPINIHSYYDNGPLSEYELLQQLVIYGPQVVSVLVTRNFQFYKKGVLKDPLCNNIDDCMQVNHAVVLVGYGTDPEAGDYWLIRNSWGPNWGENGHIRMARNNNNMCLIACWPLYIRLR